MERNRVNLTLADGDYRRLVDAAAGEGKSPTAFATDVLKAFLLRNSFGEKTTLPAPAEPDPAVFDPHSATLPGLPERQLSRQERRALERASKKGKRV